MRARSILVVVCLLAVALGAVSASAARRRHRARPLAGDGLAPRIVNGTFTAEHAATGLVLSGGNPDTAFAWCSGTLISCNTFLTAAHCVCPTTGGACQSGPGAPNPGGWLVFLQHVGFVPVIAVRVHPEYAFPVADVAVLRLGTPITGVAPVPIMTTPPAFGTAGTIVGFGNSGGAFRDYGLKRVGSVTTGACASPIDDRTSVCWTFTGDESNTCNGDSGGPLLVDDGTGPAIAGVTSGGSSLTCLPTDSSYDANVAYFAPWIEAEGGPAPPGTICGTLPPVGHPGTVVTPLTGTLSSATPARVHVVPVTAGSQRLRITLNGNDDGAADFDLYVRAGAMPTSAAYDCRTVGGSPYGACDVASPVAGPWYVLVQRFSGEGMYQVTATTFGAPAATCGNDVWESGEACDGTDAPLCAGGCSPTCACPAPCANGDLVVSRVRLARTVSLRARVANEGGAYDGFDPRAGELRVTFDDGGPPLVLSVPANDRGWAGSRPDRGSYKWKGSAPGLRKITVRDRSASRGYWDVRLTARDVPGALGLEADAITVRLDAGGTCVTGVAP